MSAYDRERDPMLIASGTVGKIGDWSYEKVQAAQETAAELAQAVKLAEAAAIETCVASFDAYLDDTDRRMWQEIKKDLRTATGTLLAEHDGMVKDLRKHLAWALDHMPGGCIRGCVDYGEHMAKLTAAHAAATESLRRRG